MHEPDEIPDMENLPVEVTEFPIRRLDIVARGLRYHVERAGNGPPLVLLHGFTGSSETWATIRAILADSYASITVDLPGHGRTEAPAAPGRYALDSVAADLAVILDELGVRRAAVLGYSLGGRAALRFALRHPSRVAALVLESSSPGIADRSEREARERADAELADSIERYGVEAFVERWERLPLWASQASLDAVARNELRAQRLANDPAGLANSLRGAGAGVDPPVHDRLPTLATPTLILAGALDTKYREIGARMTTMIPSARFELIAGAGHAIHLERPFELGRAVQAFLDPVVRDGGW